MPFEKFQPLFDLDNTDIYILQANIDERDITEIKACGIINLERNLDDFGDTAALIALMDLVITVDTSIAHLAGALGKQVWVLLPFTPDWRWLLDREDSPWYPTAKLFRQPGPGQWDAVVARVRRELVDSPPVL